MEDYKKNNLFNTFNTIQLNELNKVCETVSFKKYYHIYVPDEKSEIIYFLIKGRVKLCSYTQCGKTLIKTILYPNDMFGEEAILNLKDRSDHAIALDDNVEVLMIKNYDFKKFLCKNPELLLDVTNRIGNKLIRAEKKIENFIFKSARIRIIDFVKDTAKRQGIKIGKEILIKNFLTHYDIASIIGASRQTVCNVFGDLKKENKIYMDRRNMLVRDLINL